MFNQNFNQAKSSVGGTVEMPVTAEQACMPFDTNGGPCQHTFTGC